VDSNVFESSGEHGSVIGEAVFSPCRTYRYVLSRRWQQGTKPTVFLMMNPSKADAVNNDMTISKCIGFARKWDASGIIVVNAFAYIATSPDDIVAAYRLGIDIVGKDNSKYISAAIASTDRVVVACGSHQILTIALPTIMAMIPSTVQLSCLGFTRGGHPRHPSRLSYGTALEPYQTITEKRAA